MNVGDSISLTVHDASMCQARHTRLGPEEWGPDHYRLLRPSQVHAQPRLPPHHHPRQKVLRH